MRREAVGVVVQYVLAQLRRFGLLNPSDCPSEHVEKFAERRLETPLNAEKTKPIHEVRRVLRYLGVRMAPRRGYLRSRTLKKATTQLAHMHG